jgi:hypothetical protein
MKGKDVVCMMKERGDREEWRVSKKMMGQREKKKKERGKKLTKWARILTIQ